MSVDSNFKGKVDWEGEFTGKYKAEEVEKKTLTTIEAKQGGKSYTITVKFSGPMTQFKLDEYLKMDTTKKKIELLVDQHKTFKEMYSEKEREVIVMSNQAGNRVLVIDPTKPKAAKNYTVAEWHQHYLNRAEEKSKEYKEMLGPSKEKVKEKERDDPPEKTPEAAEAKLKLLQKRIDHIQSLAKKHGVKLVSPLARENSKE